MSDIIGIPAWATRAYALTIDLPPGYPELEPAEGEPSRRYFFYRIGPRSKNHPNGRVKIAYGIVGCKLFSMRDCDGESPQSPTEKRLSDEGLRPERVFVQVDAPMSDFAVIHNEETILHTDNFREAAAAYARLLQGRDLFTPLPLGIAYLHACGCIYHSRLVSFEPRSATSSFASMLALASNSLYGKMGAKVDVTPPAKPENFVRHAYGVSPDPPPQPSKHYPFITSLKVEWDRRTACKRHEKQPQWSMGTFSYSTQVSQ